MPSSKLGLEGGTMLLSRNATTLVFADQEKIRTIFTINGHLAMPKTAKFSKARCARALPQGGAHAPPAHGHDVSSATQRDAYGEHHDERVGAALQQLLERRASGMDGGSAAGSVPQQPRQQDQQVQQEAAETRWTVADECRRAGSSQRAFW